MKISFCTTCMNRLPQLAITLPENLAVAKSHDVELVLVNYNSSDDLDKWVESNFTSAIEEGRLRYVHEKSAPHFHASKAKNLAHRQATGEILFNLDADNYIGDCIEAITVIFRNRPNILLHGWSGNYFDGTCGRICFTRNWFWRLGGYDESFLPVGCQDTDLLLRGKGMGMIYCHLPSGRAILNSKEETIRFTGSKLSFVEMNNENERMSQENISAGKFKVNVDGHAEALISVNSGPDMVYV